VLLGQSSLILPGTSTGANAAAVPDLLEDDGDSDSDHGGVPLQEPSDFDMLDAPMNSGACGMREAGPHSQSTYHRNSTSQSEGAREDCNDMVDVVQGVPLDAITQLAPMSQSSTHSRPEAADIAAEEDSRRVRFALEGTDTDDFAQFAFPDSLVTETSSLQVLDSTQTILPRQRANEPYANARQTVPGSSSVISMGNNPHRSASEQQHGMTTPFTEAPIIDEDWWDVDDHRRSYDFTDFMDSWRLRSVVDKRAPAFPLGLQPSSKSWRPPEEVRSKDVTTNGLDIQGIPWNLIGPTRAQALDARLQMHPSRQGGYAARLFAPPPMSPMDDHTAYKFRSFTGRHRAHFCHYQLRNVLAATNRSNVFYANRTKVHHTSFASPHSETQVMDLMKPNTSAAAFRITSLATSPESFGHGSMLFAGGFYGEYAMLNIHADRSQPPTEGFVTHAYNGLVTHVDSYLGRRNGLPQAAFCSNDSKVRLLDASTGKFAAEFTYPNAVNCSAVSTDSRLRVIVGDTAEAHIADAEKGTILQTLEGHTDHAFACAWAPNTIHVATGAQDGKTLVWDARNWSRPVASLESLMSCPRSLHFADDRSLLVAENEDVISVYGANTFDKCQDIRFFGM
jgi:hypothetical protein